eukprot:gb/GEZN01004832.1/.p1 GENE.gb/GEZN01004832.1/~~gb/GEZN01004832.1/.p1  ORF type:complete len:582 (-),score=112.97 gb/GEZN01004832.1/:149-1873(-)
MSQAWQLMRPLSSGVHKTYRKKKSASMDPRYIFAYYSGVDKKAERRGRAGVVSSSSSSSSVFASVTALLSMGFGLASATTPLLAEADNDSAGGPEKNVPAEKIITRAEVAKHNSQQPNVWVIYQEGVYDITEFMEAHPGGEEKIKMAGGGNVEPFWKLYPAHLGRDNQPIPSVREQLSRLRIGRLPEEEVVQQNVQLDVEDPFYSEPTRHPGLTVLTDRPFNAETPISLIPEHFLTPTDLFYVRNHHAVPIIQPEDWSLEVEGLGLVRPATLSLDQLKTNYPQVKIVATMQCAGNRRGDMHKFKDTQGILWGVGVLSTAEWTGVRLADVLADLGVTPDCGAQHVWFEGADYPYDASLPLTRALDKSKDVLLAWEMNGQELPRDHGFPLRVIVPGVAGARNVKWLKRIKVAMQPSPSNWQRGFPYKGVFYKENFQHVDPAKYGSVYELPIQSAICIPSAGTAVEADEAVTVRGYAWSGGGRAVERVDVSCDGGKTWQEAELQRDDSQPEGRAWAWSLFQVELEIPKGHRGPLEIICKAMDSSFNSQPAKPEEIWNLRGILNNSWHRVTVRVEQDG